MILHFCYSDCVQYSYVFAYIEPIERVFNQRKCTQKSQMLLSMDDAVISQHIGVTGMGATAEFTRNVNKIFFPFRLVLLQVLLYQGAAVYPWYYRARGGVHPGQVTGLRDGQPFTLTFTLMSNLESPIKPTSLTECLWTVGGSRSTCDNPRRHRDKLCLISVWVLPTPHRKVPTRWWIQTQDRLAVMQSNKIQHEKQRQWQEWTLCLSLFSSADWWTSSSTSWSIYRPAAPHISDTVPIWQHTVSACRQATHGLRMW